MFQMNVSQFESKDILGKHAAVWCADVINNVIRVKGQARVILATGASQFEFLQYLVTCHVEWDKVTCFHLDEYLGLSVNHPASFRKYLQERVWDKVQMKTVHKLDPADVNGYEELLKENDVDIACIGIGENGHIAFNDPAVADFDDPKLVKVVELDEDCRKQQVGEGWFKSIDETPTKAVTLTIPAIMRSKVISVVVPDTRKAQAVRNALLDHVSTRCPASILRNHGDVSLWLDKDSAAIYNQDKNKSIQSGRTNIDIPGLVDLQINGYKGVDFSSASLTEDDFIQVCSDIVETGTVMFLPTVITSSMDTYENVLPLIAKVITENRKMAQIVPGIHLEGPFISAQPGARGCHDERYIIPPSINIFDKLQKLAKGKIVMITIAADQPGAAELAAYAHAQKVKVSLGHHLATPRDLDVLWNSGAILLTHLGNGIPNTIHRHNNPLMVGLSEERLHASIIADGHHLPPEVIKVILKVKGQDKICMISDMAAPAGLPPGEYKIFSNTSVVLTPDGCLRMKDSNHYAGSAHTLLQCANYLLTANLMTLDQIIQSCFYNPLKMINVDTLNVRKTVPSRLVVFDGKLQTI